jgi:hypothetical protein
MSTRWIGVAGLGEFGTFPAQKRRIQIPWRWSALGGDPGFRRRRRLVGTFGVATRAPQAASPSTARSARCAKAPAANGPDGQAWIASSVIRRAWIRQITRVSLARCASG